MKKIITFALTFLLVLSVFTLAGCGEKTVKFGVGSYTLGETKDSIEGNDGKSKTTVTVATVLLDNEGRIKDCAIDAIDIEAKFTQNGEAQDLGELKSKYQLGDAYGMKKYGNAKGEWYQEVNSLIDVIKGKKITDVKALVATNGKGNDAVTDAGCTIEITDIVMAVEKACNNAKEIEAKQDGRLKIDFSAKQTKKENATDNNFGEVKVDVSYKAKLLDKSGKEIKNYGDSLDISAKFDNKGKNID